MQGVNHFLRAAFQVGPWRITRKILLFIIVFCVVLIFFSTIVLKTHMFDEDWEDIDWDDDEDWEDGISGGDSVLLIVMGLAGIGALISSVGCCMASYSAPEQLASDSGSIFTLSGMTQSAPVASAPQPASRQPKQSRRSRADDVKSQLPTSDYPQGPSYPVNPGYPPQPPPYSAPGYPPGGMNSSAVPPVHTMDDLPPPYAPGHYPTQR